MTWKNAALLLCETLLDTPCGCDCCPLCTDETDEEGNAICALNEIEEVE